MHVVVDVRICVGFSRATHSPVCREGQGGGGGWGQRYTVF